MHRSINVLQQINPDLLSTADTIEGEEWVPVANYEGIYEVSNLGRVRSLDRVVIDKSGVTYNRKGKFIRPTFQKSGVLEDGSLNGYIIVTLSKDGKNTVSGLHRLLAQAFIPNPDPDNKILVNHIDGVKFHDSLENLEWVTPSENCLHAYKNGLSKVQYEVLRNNSKSALEKSNEVRRHPVKCIENGTVYPSVIEAQRKLHISEWSILTSLKDGKKHGGYSFTRRGIDYE